MGMVHVCPAAEAGLLVHGPWHCSQVPVLDAVQGIEAGVVLLALAGAAGESAVGKCPCKPAPVPSTSECPLSQMSSEASAKWRASHSSGKSPPDKYVPPLLAKLTVISLYQ